MVGREHAQIELDTVTVTIANGQSLSGSADLIGMKVIGIAMPSAFTGSSLTFQGSVDGTTFGDVYYEDSELSISCGASRMIGIDPIKLLPWRWVKVRSGTSGSPTNEAAERTITLVVRAI